MDDVYSGEHLLPIHADERFGEGAVPFCTALPLEHVCQVDLSAFHHHVDNLLVHLHLRVEELNDDVVELALAEQIHEVDLVYHGFKEPRIRIKFDLLQGEDLPVGRKHLEYLGRAAAANGFEFRVGYTIHENNVRPRKRAGFAVGVIGTGVIGARTGVCSGCGSGTALHTVCPVGCDRAKLEGRILTCVADISPDRLAEVGARGTRPLALTRGVCGAALAGVLAMIGGLDDGRGAVSSSSGAAPGVAATLLAFRRGSGTVSSSSGRALRGVAQIGAVVVCCRGTVSSSSDFVLCRPPAGTAADVIESEASSVSSIAPNECDNGHCGVALTWSSPLRALGSASGLARLARFTPEIPC
eukprot:scaffold223392_cov31-Tisochrysis_lutea.AAC.3